MVKKFLLLLFVFILCSVGVSALTPITNCTDLQDISLSLAEDYYLTNDIDCSDTYNWNWNGTHYEGFSPVGGILASTLNLNGRNFTISNLYIYRPANPYQMERLHCHPILRLLNGLCNFAHQEILLEDQRCF